MLPNVSTPWREWDLNPAGLCSITVLSHHLPTTSHPQHVFLQWAIIHSGLVSHSPPSFHCSHCRSLPWSFVQAEMQNELWNMVWFIVLHYFTYPDWAAFLVIWRNTVKDPEILVGGNPEGGDFFESADAGGATGTHSQSSWFFCFDIQNSRKSLTSPLSTRHPLQG